MPVAENFDLISDDELDTLVAGVLHATPQAGSRRWILSSSAAMLLTGVASLSFFAGHRTAHLHKFATLKYMLKLHPKYICRKSH